MRIRASTERLLSRATISQWSLRRLLRKMRMPSPLAASSPHGTRVSLRIALVPAAGKCTKKRAADAFGSGRGSCAYVYVHKPPPNPTLTQSAPLLATGVEGGEPSLTFSHFPPTCLSLHLIDTLTSRSVSTCLSASYSVFLQHHVLFLLWFISLEQGSLIPFRVLLSCSQFSNCQVLVFLPSRFSLVLNFHLSFFLMIPPPPTVPIARRTLPGGLSVLFLEDFCRRICS